MRKDFGIQTYFFPLPVLIIGTYDENGTPNAMNVAWGGIYDYGKIMIQLASHKTTDNIEKMKAFTISFADKAHLVEADYVGIISGNDEPKKLEIASLHTQKSKFVNAPLITEFPVTLECELDYIDDGTVIGNIKNVSADESVLGKDGKIDVEKLDLIAYDPVKHTYYEMGKVVGNAFKDGKKLINK